MPAASEDPRATFGDNLRSAREHAGLTQEALGHQADFHPTEVNRIERGRRNPGLLTIVRLAKALGIPAGDLLAGLPPKDTKTRAAGGHATMRAVTARREDLAVSARSGRRCAGRKKDGSPCERYAIRGRDRCAAHPREGDAPGAPSKLTVEVQETIIRNLASGVGVATAAEAAGVSARSAHAWLAKAVSEDAAGVSSERVIFLHRVTRARAQVRVLLAATIVRASQVDAGGDWRAAAWMLERIDPESFGRQATIAQHQPALGTLVSDELLGGPPARGRADQGPREDHRSA